MRISPITNNIFTGSYQDLSKEKKVKHDRITQTAMVVLPTLLMGGGYVTFHHPDYSESIKTITDNNIFKPKNFDIKNFLEYTHLSNVKIEQTGDKEYKFNAYYNYYESLEGTIEKSKNNDSFVCGEFTKKGFGKDNYKYSAVIEYPKNSHDDSYKIKLILHDEDNNAKEFRIEKNGEEQKVTINGKEIMTKSSSDEMLVTGIMLAVILLGAANLMRKP